MRLRQFRCCLYENYSSRSGIFLMVVSLAQSNIKGDCKTEGQEKRATVYCRRGACVVKGCENFRGTGGKRQVCLGQVRWQKRESGSECFW